MMLPIRPLQSRTDLPPTWREQIRRLSVASASLNGRSENVVVKAIIIPELELRNVKSHIFLATLWKVPTTPRQGAQAQARQLAASKIPVVVAVSCNVATFARDARILLDGGYRIEGVTPVDQFRHTPHVELVARFVRGI